MWEKVLDQRFCTGKPGENRVSDITYPRASGNWAYLTMIAGLFGRKVVGWALSGDMEAVHNYPRGADGVYQPENPGESDIPLRQGGVRLFAGQQPQPVLNFHCRYQAGLFLNCAVCCLCVA
jgi:hypothetical protein